MNDYLEELEAQLSELTERGAHQRLRARRPGFGGGGPRPPRRRSSELVAVVAAAAVAVVVVAIIVLNVGSSPTQPTPASQRESATASATHSSTSTTHPSATVPGNRPPGPVSLPIPADFHAQSFTAISELTWWLLGSASCPAGQSGTCAGMLQTTDGGRTFTAIHPPAPTSSTYSQLRFADGKNGFAYGPDLYATHDGGATWHAVDLGGQVKDLAIANGEAFAIVTNQLMHSPVDQDAWTPVSAAGQVSGGLWVEGSSVIVQSGSGDGFGTSVLVSHDAGTSFATYPAPSPGLPCQFQGAASPDLWAQCATGTESGVWVSSDGGKDFTTADGSGAHLSLPNSAAFGAASGTTAVVGYQQLYRTGDAGATWTAVGPSGIAEWAYVGFTDSTHGVALGYVGSIAPGNEQLYYTTDGGESYHLVQLP